MNHNNQEYLGVDVGSARVGVARGSSLARLAEPLMSVPAAAAVEELKKLARDKAAAGVVVGLPRGLDGAETAQTQTVRDWVQAAQAELNLLFYWQDEALTSQAAAAKLQASNFKPQTADEHALAAAIILQDFLDTPKTEWVRC